MLHVHPNFIQVCIHFLGIRNLNVGSNAKQNRPRFFNKKVQRKFSLNPKSFSQNKHSDDDEDDDEEIKKEPGEKDKKGKHDDDDNNKNAEKLIFL